MRPDIDSLDSQLLLLKGELMKMGRFLQAQIAKSVKSLVEKDLALANEVIKADDIIDRMQLDIEQKCYQIIAMKQPVAGDLRLLGTVLRNIVDMERMADHAEDIAKIAIRLHEQEFIKPLIDIPRMAKLAEVMTERALQAFVDADVEMAMSLVDEEREMDGLYEQVFRDLLFYMMSDTRNIPQAMELEMVAVHLERIGDHATNLAEMVVYAVEGRRLDMNQIAREKHAAML